MWANYAGEAGQGDFREKRRFSKAKSKTPQTRKLSAKLKTGQLKG
jgi:hypothetical protein